MIDNFPKNVVYSRLDYGFQEIICPKNSSLMDNKQKSGNLTMKEIHFWELPDTVRLRLNPEFLARIFDELSNAPGFAEAAEKLSISTSHLYNLKNGRYPIKPSSLVKIAGMVSIDLSNFEQQIVSLNATTWGSAKSDFPISSDEKIASVIGHYYGDGSIITKESQFKFCNCNQKSLDAVKSEVAERFESPSNGETNTTLTSSSIIGEILWLQFDKKITFDGRVKNRSGIWKLSGGESKYQKERI